MESRLRPGGRGDPPAPRALPRGSAERAAGGAAGPAPPPPWSWAPGRTEPPGGGERRGLGDGAALRGAPSFPHRGRPALRGAPGPVSPRGRPGAREVAVRLGRPRGGSAAIPQAAHRGQRRAGPPCTGSPRGSAARPGLSFPTCAWERGSCAGQDPGCRERHTHGPADPGWGAASGPPGPSRPPQAPPGPSRPLCEVGAGPLGQVVGTTPAQPALRPEAASLSRSAHGGPLGQGRKSLTGLSHKPLPRRRAVSCPTDAHPPLGQRQV